MQIDAQKRTVGEILRQGQHIVPRYQRRYAWETQNIKDFWNDIRDSSGPHFLGSMVTSGATSAPREVIDGQQRLTTAIIALSVLRDLYGDLGSAPRVTGISEYLEFNDRNGDRIYRLKNKDAKAASRLNDNILIEKSRREDAPGFDPGALETQAYGVFEDLVRKTLSRSEEQDAVTLLDEIRDSILETEVVYINVEDRKSAFIIFETLNDRGKSLTVMDLVKNLLFSELSGGDDDSSERTWSDTLESIDELTFEGMSPDSFLYYAWNSRHHAKHPNADIVENARLRRSVSDHMESSTDRLKTAQDLIADLSKDASILASLNQTLMSNGSPESWRAVDGGWRRDKYEVISNHLYGVMLTGASQPLPLLLSLMRAYLRDSGRISSSILISFLKEVESFQFRWSVSQKSSTSTIRRLYRHSAALVSTSSSKTGFETAMGTFVEGAAKIGATDAQFKDGISKLVYSRTRGKDAFKIRRILTSIEKGYPTTRLDLGHQLSLEHLQGLEGRSEATYRNSWIFKIGNLALVPPQVNANLPREFADKCDELKDWINPGDAALTGAISTGTWRSEQSNDRLGAIAQRATELWAKS